MFVFLSIQSPWNKFPLIFRLDIYLFNSTLDIKIFITASCVCVFFLSPSQSILHKFSIGILIGIFDS